jgi:hypothetical protein
MTLWLAALLAGELALVSPARALERLEPVEGCYLGFNLGEGDTIARLSARLGFTPAVYVRFFNFPLAATERMELNRFLAEALETGGIALITLEPWQGLDSVTESACAELGTICSAFEEVGIDGIMIRFGHEMNGNWYPWGQQPILYKQEFRLLAQNVHSRTARTALLWAPNYGVGYPYGAPRPRPGSPEFISLDTNGDGVLTEKDDMYEPYYPGDDVVDWVGMTLYHWGVDYPWFENELPLPNSFADSLTGTHQGVTPNFYARYCAEGVHQKPMAIPETAAFYNTQQPGADEFAIKAAWWQQVFNIAGDTPKAPDVAVHFPRLKCVNWFDHYKRESEAQNDWIDWRVSSDPRIRAAFVRSVRALRHGQHYFLTAQEEHWQQSPYAITAKDLPALLPLAGPISVSLQAKAPAGCDLVIDLLDEQDQWQGGTRVPVAAGAQTVSAAFPLVQPLKDGSAYRWSLFLTPAGASYQRALAWYQGGRPVARAIVPAIQIVASPPVLPSSSNFTVRVAYTAAESCAAVVNLLDADYLRRGRGTVNVSRGDGSLDIPVTLQPGVTNGNCTLECFLSNSSTNWQTVYARSKNFTVRATPQVLLDSVNAIAEPAVVPAGEVFRLVIDYVAIHNRDLHIDLFDAHTSFLAGNLQPVPQGSGIRDLTISYPDAPPGEYFITVFITPSGQSWEQALAWGAERRITVVGSDYQRWIESYWGTVLGNDPVNPRDDADGDGACNTYEFVAGTNPRDAAAVLKAEIAKSEAGLTVSWRSIASGRYQLFQCPQLGGEVWMPVGGPVIGTGAKLEISVPAESSVRFFRVEVLP